MTDADHLRREIIAPALRHIGMWSGAAENLLLGTAAVESRMGTYLRQVGGGPALGIWQVEPVTHLFGRGRFEVRKEGLPRVADAAVVGEHLVETVGGLRVGRQQGSRHQGNRRGIHPAPTGFRNGASLA